MLGVMCQHADADKRRWVTPPAGLSAEDAEAAGALMVLMSAPEHTPALANEPLGRTRWCSKCAVWITRHMGWVPSRRDGLAPALLRSMAPAAGAGDAATLAKRAAVVALLPWAAARQAAAAPRARRAPPAAPPLGPVPAPGPAPVPATAPALALAVGTVPAPERALDEHGLCGLAWRLLHHRGPLPAYRALSELADALEEPGAPVPPVPGEREPGAAREMLASLAVQMSLLPLVPQVLLSRTMHVVLSLANDVESEVDLESAPFALSWAMFHYVMFRHKRNSGSRAALERLVLALH